MDQVQMRGGNRTDLLVDRLDNAEVLLEDVGHAYSPDAASIKVVGGPASAAGKTTTGKTIVFSGAASGNRTSYELSAGAKVLVRDLWYESGAGPGFAKVSGRADFTVDGARISSPRSQKPAAFVIDAVDGRVAILLAHIDDGLAISGAGGNTKLVVIGGFAEQQSRDYVADTSSPPGRLTILGSRHLSWVPGIRSAASENSGSADPVFIRMMLAQTRGEHPVTLSPLGDGISDVRMFRVWVSGGLNNIAVTR
jgi:hypothetical protein